jgi:hypothetical protein
MTRVKPGDNARNFKTDLSRSVPGLNSPDDLGCFLVAYQLNIFFKQVTFPVLKLSPGLTRVVKQEHLLTKVRRK